jgi:hypothetical protein
MNRPNDLQTIQKEQGCLKEDLRAFKHAYKALEVRVLASNQDKRIHTLDEWPGTHAAMGSLILAITSLENLISDYHRMILELGRGGEGYEQ